MEDYRELKAVEDAINKVVNGMSGAKIWRAFYEDADGECMGDALFVCDTKERAELRAWTQRTDESHKVSSICLQDLDPGDEITIVLDIPGKVVGEGPQKVVQNG